MELKIYLYVFFTLFSVFVLSGVNFDPIIKKNKVIEARLLVLSLSMALSYLLTNFVLDFIN